MRINLLAGALALLCAVDARSAVLYADSKLTADITNGTYSVANRAAGGKDGNAYAKIQSAVNAMNPGDVLYLRGGRFLEHSIDLANKQGKADSWFKVSSYPGEWAIVDGGHQGSYVVFLSEAARAKAPRFWRFEYFEVTGGGPDTVGKVYDDIHSEGGGGFMFRPGMDMVFDHLYIHHNFGGGGGNAGAGIRLGNESGGSYNVTITHCYIAHNGWPGKSHTNLANIIFFSDYVDDPARVNQEVAMGRNVVKFNLIEGGNMGLKHKNSQWLTGDHLGKGMTFKTYGNTYHNNIIRNPYTAGLWIRTDFDQIHNNIFDGCPTGVTVGEPPGSSDREPFHVTLYNNTFINSDRFGIRSLHGEGVAASNYETRPLHPYHYFWNNVFHKGPNLEDKTRDLAILYISTQQEIDMATVKVDNNYFQGRTRLDGVISVAHHDSKFSVNDYQSRGWAKSQYAAGEQADNPLFKTGTPYRLRPEHVVAGTTTIANGGIGGAHPYLPGKVIPSYLGATDPADDAWVQEVLNLADLPKQAVSIKTRIKPRNLPAKDYRRPD